jgi:hypothetical protein
MALKTVLLSGLVELCSQSFFLAFWLGLVTIVVLAGDC